MPQIIPNNNQNGKSQWDWPAALFLLAAMLTASRRLLATDWTEHLVLVQTLTLLGTLTGLALAYSRFSNETKIAFSASYGLFFSLWLLGRTLGPGIEWTERLMSLLGRMMNTIDKMTAGSVVSDPLLFLLLMSLLFWVLSLTAAHTLVHTRKPWRAVIPAGITLVIIHTYDAFLASRMWYLAVFLLFSLGLVSRFYYLERRAEWVKERAHMPLYVGVDMMRITMAAAALLIVVSWAAPAFASSLEPAERLWLELTEPWQEIRDDLGKAFASLQASVGGVTDYYGDNLPLGRGNTLGDQPVLEITTATRPSSNIRFYWRARTYNYYDPFDQGWVSTLDTGILASPDEDSIPAPAYNQGRWDNIFTITTKSPISVIYTPAQPVWVSRPANYTLGYNPDGTADIAFIRAENPILSGEVYEVSASVTDATILQLRAAGTNYPDWVLERYLQIPLSTTQRTKDLAQEIAAGLDNPYDIVEAVTQYLRDNITFVEIIPAIPESQEPIDWMLFELGEGFCNYYATAEIIMLRSLGIPARMAVGYAQGERTLGIEEELALNNQEFGQTVADIEESTRSTEFYTVRQSDLHAWPEVYFPGIGWVEFEPTSAQAPLVRALGEELDLTGPQEEDIPIGQEESNFPEEDPLDESPLPDPADQAPEESSTWLNRTATLSILITGVVLTAGSFGWRALRKRGTPPMPVLVERGFRRFNLEPPKFILLWAHNASLSPLGKAYMEINKALNRLGKPAGRHATPAERAAALAHLLPPLHPAVEKLCFQYQAGTYSPLRAAEIETAQEAGKEIRRTSYLAWLQKWFSRWQEPEEERSDLPTLMKEHGLLEE